MSFLANTPKGTRLLLRYVNKTERLTTTLGDLWKGEDETVWRGEDEKEEEGWEDMEAEGVEEDERDENVTDEDP